jgi:hypothetical protein
MVGGVPGGRATADQDPEEAAMKAWDQDTGPSRPATNVGGVSVGGGPPHGPAQARARRAPAP